MLELLGQILVVLLLLVGSFFLLVGSYGLAKLPSLMQRLHAPTKSSTLGLGGLLLASMLEGWLRSGRLSLHELLIFLFVFLSAPVSAHMLAKARILRSKGEAQGLPPTGRPVGWATLEGSRPSE
ncbi:MAG: Na+/H+ antiporter subunit G [Geminicoccaceae bacterium]